jgi:hypothetical protein
MLQIYTERDQIMSDTFDRAFDNSQLDNDYMAFISQEIGIASKDRLIELSESGYLFDEFKFHWCDTNEWRFI